VEYKPGSSVDSATLTISDSDAGSPQHVALSGRAMVPYFVPAELSASESRRVPAPTGTYAIGTRVLHKTDNARVDTLSATGELRALSLRFWYPANIGKCRAAAYASPAVWSVLSKLAGMRLPAVATNSCANAPILAGFYPVVVFSHGLTGTFTDYTFLFEDLASRGYVVASVDHTYDASAVDLGDGRIARSRFGSYLTRVAPLDELEARQLEATRLGDIRFVLDELERLQNQPDSPFAGHLNVAAMAVAGHSFGGLTALEALHFDSRLRAAVALEGVMPDASFAATNRPVLLLDAGRRQWPEREQGVWQKLQGPRLAINLPGAGHLSPSDAVWYAKGTVATGSLSPEQAVSAIRDSVATFLDVQLRRRPEQALTQELLVAYPNLEITLPKEDVR
jgi:dienelactone hydrolase